MTSPNSPVPNETVDLTKVSRWMDEQGLVEGPIRQVELLSGGTQNVLLRFERAGRRFVLRRPPPHKRANSDETMRREARVLAALADSDVPHPRLIAACPDEDVIGAAFYLMEPIEGFNATTGMPELHASDPDVRRQMGFSMVDGIAALGRVDFRAVGLEGFGKPDGWLERQVSRWVSQLESYSKLEGYPGPDIPGVDRVARWLDDNRPTDYEPGILHGDFHMANVMFELDSPKLAAIVDWELSTIGDPLLDLAWLVATWPSDDGPVLGTVSASTRDGFPKADELVDHYRDQTLRSLDSLAWYTVLACFKLGIILEGTNARAFAGKAPRETGDALHATTVGLFSQALRRIEEA